MYTAEKPKAALALLRSPARLPLLGRGPCRGPGRPFLLSTSNAATSTEPGFTVALSLTLENRIQNTVPWSPDHAGTYKVKFFDEESCSLPREAQTNTEDTAIVPPLFGQRGPSGHLAWAPRLHRGTGFAAIGLVTDYLSWLGSHVAVTVA
uniref:Uncharacterized protein n=1 Tax=Sus scrofa TaxID=9823 RepID=A0A8D1BAI4_PIG